MMVNASCYKFIHVFIHVLIMGGGGEFKNVSDVSLIKRGSKLKLSSLRFPNKNLCTANSCRQLC